jgi:hypothetical protein
LLIYVDRDKDTITASIGNGETFEPFSNLKYIFIITAALILLMAVLIFYLVKLRTRRIKADEWLENHKEEIISYALYKRTGDEIVQALVNAKELADKSDPKEVNKALYERARALSDNTMNWFSESDQEAADKSEDGLMVQSHRNPKS